MLEAVYLTVLLGSALLYHYNPGKSSPGAVAQLRKIVPDPIGWIPLAVPWYGALGAVTFGLIASYGGVAPATVSPYEAGLYNTIPWHIVRPIVGVVLGVIVYALCRFLIAPQEPTSVGLTRSPGPDVIAFLAGYRESTFFALIDRATGAVMTELDAGRKRIWGAIVAVIDRLRGRKRQ